jgi:hypothetical protein|tara:strand:- start:548 stop:871 length:324 start_codon:yes stop_codon:yes gene_type:complete
MITEKRLEEALKYLAESDNEHAKLSAGVEYIKDLAKHYKGKYIMNSEEKSVALKEQSYYASDEYKKHIDDKKDLINDLTLLENKRSKESLVIDVWRTLEASRRKNNI